MREITKYIAYDGVPFDTLEEANRYETAAFNRWLESNEYHLFVHNAETRVKIEIYETQRQAREGVMWELFLYEESE